MSFLTRCPICETIFRIDARALAASDGAAKCGVCGMVFNAIDHHVPDLTLPKQPDETVIPDHEPVTLSDLEDFSLEFDTVDLASNAENNEHTAGVGVTIAKSEPDAHPEQPSATESQYLTADPPSVANSSVESSASPIAAQSGQDQPAHSLLSALGTEHADHDPGAPASDPAVTPVMELAPNPTDEHQTVPVDTPALVTKATSTHPVRQIVLAAVLAVLLMAQLAWLGRYTLLARFPLLLSFSTRVCAHASCLLTDPAGNLDGLRLVSTDLAMVPEQPHILHVHFTMQSDSPLPLPVPPVSLILTDAQDNLLVQRNFAPAQYLQHRLPVLPTGVEIPGDLYLNVGTLAVSNFKLLLIPG